MNAELQGNIGRENSNEPKSHVELALEKAAQGKKYNKWPDKAKELMLKRLAKLLNVAQLLNSDNWKYTYGDSLISELEDIARKSGHKIQEGQGKKQDHNLFTSINRELFTLYNVRTTQTPRIVFKEAVTILRTGGLEEISKPTVLSYPQTNTKMMRKSERPPETNPFNK